MKLQVGTEEDTDTPIKGIAPKVSPRLLPHDMGQIAICAKLLSGDIEAYNDLKPTILLAKSAPINTIFQLPTGEWLQWEESEVTYGVNVDVTFGPIPGDASGRVFITGIKDKPQWTNHYYATDPSQQGANVLHAYPYVTSPLGIDGPADAPVATGSSDPTTFPAVVYQYAAPTAVNSGLVNAGGSGWAVDDFLTLTQGTLQPNLTPAKFQVTEVDGGGSGSGVVTGLRLVEGGFYQFNLGPPATGALTLATSPSSGIGLTLDLSLVSNPSFGSWTPQIYNSIHYANPIARWTGAVIPPGGPADSFPWSLDAAHKLGLTVDATTFTYSTDIYGILNSYSVDFQVDFQSVTSRGTVTSPTLWFPGVFSNTTLPPTNLPYMKAARVVFFSNETYDHLASGLTNLFALYDEDSNLIQSIPLTYDPTKNYRLAYTAISTTAGTVPGFNVTATVVALDAPTTILATLTGFVKNLGETLAFGVSNVPNTEDSETKGLFANVQVTVKRQNAVVVPNEFVNYVITYNYRYQLNDIDTFVEESRPSDPSNTVSVVNNSTAAVPSWGPATVTWDAPPADVDSVNLYRSATASDGSTVYLLDQADIPPGTLEITDTVLDSELGSALVTTGFDPPPDDLQGILALPNGIMAGFSKNILCLSAQNYPYGWPVLNQYNTSEQIVAIAAIDSTVLILTTGYPYTAWGNTPDSFSMSKETFTLGCASKRSVCYLRGVGIAYASAEGLVSYSGQGRQAKLTETFFTKEQWQKLNPSSMLAAVHDGRYFFWYNRDDDSPNALGGYVLDTNANGFGLISLDFHVTSTYVDPLTDTLYFTLDDGTTQPANEILAWDSASTLRPWTWRSKKFLTPMPLLFAIAQVVAADYGDLNFKFLIDGVVVFDQAITSGMEFVLPATFSGADCLGNVYEMELSGTSTVRYFQVAEVVEELT